MDLFSIPIFDKFSPFYFISQHITVGYLCSLTLIYVIFLLIWIRFASSASFILAIFPFAPIFNYFFYASSNISILLFLGKSGLGLLWLFCIFLIFVISILLIPKIKSFSKSNICATLGKNLYKISNSPVCCVLFFIILCISIYVSYSGGIVQGFNDPNRTLYSFGGGIRKYITQILLEPYLFLYACTLLLTSKKISPQKLLIFFLYMSYSVTIRLFSGSKGFILGFIFFLSLIIYKFQIVPKIFKSLKRFRLHYGLMVVTAIISIFLFIFITSPLSSLFFYLVEYQFVSPIQCTTVVIKESIDPVKTIGANYFLLLLEPLHKLNIGIKQYRAGNAINLASNYLIDSDYGGTNPSVFCQSTSEDYSALLIPFFWAMFSSWFIACSSAFCNLVNQESLNCYVANSTKILPSYYSSFSSKKRYYSNLGATFIFLLIYNFDTPQAAWIDWLLDMIYDLIGISFWLLLLSIIKNRK